MCEDRTALLVLVSDHPIVRNGIRATLCSLEHIRIVGEASGGQEALQKAKELSPDIAIVDIVMPGMDGLETIKHVREEAPQCRVIVLSAHEDVEYILEALRSGARGYLTKKMPSAELIRAVETVQRGQIYIPPDISQRVFEAYCRQGEHQAGLSPREEEVLVLIARGCSNKEIADRLSVSIRTVEAHRSHIMSKLNVHTVAGMIKYAIAKGIESSE